jgi:hypothetical protein
MAYETGRPTTVDPSAVSSRDEFADFLQAVFQAYGDTGQTEWENNTLPRFLDALIAVAWSRIEGRANQDDASWRLSAEMIVAATGYE